MIRTKNELKPFQKEGAKFLSERKEALLADEMRLGKTVQSIAACDLIKANRVLVICPASVKLHWQDEFKLWSDRDLKSQVVFGSRYKMQNDCHITIINYDLLRYKEIFNQLRSMRFAVGIFDEAHYLKGTKSKRTKAVFLKGAIASRCIYKWFLTGTPILNRPVELFPMLRAVAPWVITPYMSYNSYAKHFCGGYFDGFQIVAKGASNKQDLNNRLNGGFMLRRTKKEVFKELPPPKCELLPISAEGKLKTLVKKELAWTSKDAKYQKLIGEEEIATVRHNMALGKLPMAISHIKYLLTLSSKVVVFAYHRDVIKGLTDALLEYIPVVVHGGVSEAKRHQRIKMFRERDDVRVFIGQYVAAGVGIDLSAASTILFVESSWVPGEIDQAMARCDNLAKINKVLVQFLVVEDSVEEHMLRTVIDKKRTIKEIIEPERKKNEY